MYIVVLPTLVRGCWLYVECGSSASGRRRSLRYEARTLNLPQVRNLREIGDNGLHEGVGSTHGSTPTIYLINSRGCPKTLFRQPRLLLDELALPQPDDILASFAPDQFPSGFTRWHAAQ